MTLVSGWSLRSVLRQLGLLLALVALTTGFASSAFAQANPNTGPGGPILVVTSSGATFSKYYAEILRAEGFNEFAVTDISTVTSTLLNSYDVVILGKVSLTSSQVTTLTNWVNAGGNLIAMDPDAQLSSLLGLTITSTTLPNGYIAVDTSTRIGNGIVGDSMQYHGSGTLHTLNGATRLATLYANSTTPTASSAISLRSVGSNGGQAAAFAYDLATSIVYTRQGNPAWVGQERDGTGPIRSDDMFFGNANGDPQLDWIDRSKIAIPQADEQQRLLANLILEMNSDRKPLPRFWYLPNGHKAAVVMTGDDHANAGTRARWNEFLAASPAGCNLDNWECVRGTSYLFVGTPMTNAELAAFEAQGFEVGVHINTGCSDYTQASLTSTYDDQLAAYHGDWPSLPNPKTMRHHCIVWSDWASGAKVELAHGIRLDTTYYYWPGPNWVNDTPGHFTGSAIPMRFADLDGTIIDVYQAASQMTDESNQSYPFTPDTLLDRAIGPQEQYGVYTINAHTDLDIEPESTTTVASAQARGVPVVSARQMLTWLDGRNSSSFGSLAYSNGSLTFTVTAATGSNGLQGMLPLRSNNRVLSTIKRGTADVSYEVVNVKGYEYATFPATTGSYTAAYVTDSTAPTIVSITPANAATGVNPSGSVRVQFNESVDSGTINLSTIDLRTAGGVVVPASVTYDAANRTAVLTPSGALAAGSTFTLTVRGGATDPRVKDLVGNALASTSTTTFSTGAPTGGCPCSGWSESTVPGQTAANDSGAVELGVKFRANTNGFVTGLRFYKGATNTGTHVGNIWNAAGQNLGSAVFQNESASGWQTVTFATPIEITANTSYIASYYAPNGNYAADGGYFNSSRTSGPLYFPSTTEDGGNGLFAYGGGGVAPTGTYGATNYYVDVIFTVAGGNGDTTAPSVAITSPTNTGSYTSPNGSLVISGTASDASGISAVLWTNNRGGSGTATGTTSWSTSAISLQTGANVITVTARDVAGNLAATTITVTYNGDATAPTVTNRTPGPGATAVPVLSKVLVVFSEAISPASLTTSTFELRTAANVVVPSSVSYNSASLTATLTPTSPLNTSTTYTVNVKGGATAPQVKDLAGNSLAATSTWTFTTNSSVCPCTIWDAATVPTTPSADDTTAVEVGVKFRSSSTGSLTGIRFYKGSLNSGSHVAHLWSVTGQLIATATFDSETATGWQQANFTQPVPILANTTYIASYHAPNGGYASTTNYFASSGATNLMLTALQNGLDGTNGVFKYGPPGTFPDQSWNASNYWVDVVFSTTQIADTAPPVVTGRSPVNGATNVTLASPITVTFNEALDVSTVTSSTFELRNTANNTVVSATVGFNAGTNVVTISPTASLLANTPYTVTVRGGATDPRVKDTSGNALASNDTFSFTTGTAAGPCAINAITQENCLIGNLPAEWDISGAGDASIQGFATQISVNKGQTVQFKIDTVASSYRLDIYRMGYYGGRGARKITSVNPTLILPQGQDPDACVTQASTTGLIDCGAWKVTASWPVPATAVSGIYFAKVIRTDAGGNGGASHIFFIVRDDASTSKMVFQTSDTTWQAYNNWGGNSLYVGGPGTNPGRAYKVSYNRPFNTRAVDDGQDWVFNSEYPMVRWLEANGYDVTYITGVDTDRAGSLLLNHKIFLSVGHDEYWSGQQRANVEAARNAGVHLAFFSGNEVFWKTRWENSIDGSNTAYRTLVSYKETHAGAKIDPTSTWTGTWRDGRFSTDGGKPENALTGTIFKVNVGTVTMTVPGTFGKLRFWRNTQIAGMGANQTATLTEGTVGYEWDDAPDDASAPPGLVRLSSTLASGVLVLQDLGSTYASGTAKHAMTLYKHSSGAIVFGAGTIQWPWALDSVHDRGSAPADINARQATVNLFADMGVLPNTVQPDLIVTSASSDSTAPTAVVTSPTAGGTAAVSSALVISGTANDVGGEVGAVEVSTDGGATWRSATLTYTTAGSATWTYTWRPTAQGSATILARATDDSLNRGGNSSSVTITVGPASAANCPCTLFDASQTAPPDNDTHATVTGVKFSTSVAGTVSALRFYKNAENVGTHTGTLWNANGSQIASVVFTNETASGWQQMNLPTPVTLQPNVTYVVAYHSPSGRYAGSDGYFNGFTQESGPLTAPSDETVDGGNGVYAYGSAATFPSQTYGAANYWADVVFTPSASGDTTAPVVALTSPTSAATYSTSSSTLSLAGTASDAVGVTQVTWSNNRGGSGTATGTTSWSVPSVTLQTGTNVLTVSARDQAGNVGTKTLTVTYAVSADTTAPVVTITSPNNGNATSTTSATVTLSGTSSDAVGVTQVSWSNSLTGGSGTASGTTAWTASNIPLQVGVNTITISSRDAAGNVGTDTQAITFSDTTLPTLNITAPQASGTFTTSANSVTLSGTASDNVGVTQVSWSSNKGNSGIATGTTSWSAAGIRVVRGTNVITVTARDAANNLRTAQLTINSTAAADATKPTVTIQSPTANSTTTSDTVTLSGIASDNDVLLNVTWANNRGGSGTATGTTSWSAGTVQLQPGANVLTVTAKDLTGNTQAASVTVTFNAPITYGMVAAYNFNQTSGTSAPDRSGNNNAGTVTSGTWATAGKFGGALSLNGTSSRVFVNSAASLNLTSGATLMAWVRPANNTQSGNRTIVKKENNNYWLYAGRSGGSTNTMRPGGGVTMSNNTQETVSTSTQLAANTWTHVAITYNGSAVQLYLNGQPSGSANSATGLMSSANSPLWIGGNNNGEYFQGLIDEVRVYNRALTQAEISTASNTAIP